jgi:hypothetical protein
MGANGTRVDEDWTEFSEGRMKRVDMRGRGSWQSRARLLAWIFLAIMLIAASRQCTAADFTPEEYVREVGGDAHIVPAEKLVIDGNSLICGRRPTVFNSKLDDYGAAFPGFLILNPKLLAKVASTQVKLWIYSHECGHQFRGPDEATADCFGVQRGRRQRWLTPEGLEEVCRFISPAKSDSLHFQGAERCEAMRRCYADPSIK